MDKKIINIFYSSKNYIGGEKAEPFNHLSYIFSKLKKNSSIKVNEYADEYRKKLFNVLKNTYRMTDDSINILLPGNSFLYAFISIFILRRKAKFISLIWNIPGSTDDRVSAKINDYIIKKVLQRCEVVFYISKIQEKPLIDLVGRDRIRFMPVIADCKYWKVNKIYTNILERLNLINKDFILCVGGGDRNEKELIEYSIKQKKHLVRVTQNENMRDNFISICKSMQFNDYTIGFKLSNEELRDLYFKSLVVYIPLINKTNPAGLTSITEMMCVDYNKIITNIDLSYYEDPSKLHDYINENIEYILNKIILHDGVNKNEE